MLLRKYVLLLSLLPAVAGAFEAALLPDEIGAAMRARNVPAGGVSIFVQEVGKTEPLLAIDTAKPRNPASAMKLLTTWVALETLGPAWTWSTEAYLDGELNNGTLDGNLVLKGYGDPYLVTERLWSFQRNLRLRGLQEIQGDLVIDNTYFDLPLPDTARFDGEGLRAYNVAPDALLVNFQAMYMLYQPDAANNNVKLLVEPMPTNLRIDNRLKLVNGRCGGYQNGISVEARDDNVRDHLVISGNFGRNCARYGMTRSALTAPTFAYGVFRALWEESGGVLSGSLAMEAVPEESEPFYSMESPPLADVITYVNKFSNNVMARHLFLTVGAEIESPPATLEKSRKVFELQLKKRGLEFPELVIDNGAGLSRDTRISAEHLGAVLQKASESPWKAEFVSSMSLPGLDGTLRKRFTYEAATGRMHLKTGRLRDVYATAGYVHADSGREYIVVILNNFPGADDGPGEAVQEALLRWVYKQ